MGSEDTIRADESALLRAHSAGDGEALVEIERRHRDAIRAGFDAGVHAWGDLGLDFSAFSRRVADSVAREHERDPDGFWSIELSIGGLALADLYLAAACALGHDVAWRRFDGSFGPFIAAVARAIVRRSRDAEEILAGLYSDLFFPKRRGDVTHPSSLARYAGRASLRTWLRSVLFTRVQDFYSKRRRAPWSLDRAKDENEAGDAAISDSDRALLARDIPDETIERRDLVRVVVEALEQSIDLLDSDERLVFHAYFVEDRTIEEIARLFDAHRATIGRRLKRARTKIVRSIETRLRLESSAARGEFRRSIPAVAKELLIDWTRILGGNRRSGRDSS